MFVDAIAWRLGSRELVELREETFHRDRATVEATLEHDRAAASVAEHAGANLETTDARRAGDERANRGPGRRGRHRLRRGIVVRRPLRHRLGPRAGNLLGIRIGNLLGNRIGNRIGNLALDLAAASVPPSSLPASTAAFRARLAGVAGTPRRRMTIDAYVTTAPTPAARVKKAYAATDASPPPPPPAMAIGGAHRRGYGFPRVANTRAASSSGMHAQSSSDARADTDTGNVDEARETKPPEPVPDPEPAPEPPPSSKPTEPLGRA